MSANGVSSLDPQYNSTLPRALGSPSTSMSSEDNFIIRSVEIRQIIIEACRSVVGAQRYAHDAAGEWNSRLIETILNKLMQELERQRERRYKLIVNSSIAQQIAPSPTNEVPSNVRGTRGLHVANAAFWDPPCDGMFSYKYAADKDRDFDIVVSVVWLSHDGYTMPAPDPEQFEGRPPHVVA